MTNKITPTLMRNSILRLGENAIREVPSELIRQGEIRSRLPFKDDDVADLVKSIRKFGQLNPLICRYIFDQPSRYEIVCGSRRLRALKILGLPAMAIIKTLDDTSAWRLAAMDNRSNFRFIENAFCILSLIEQGVNETEISDKSDIPKKDIREYLYVARSIPHIIISFIGPVSGISKIEWIKLADKISEKKIDGEKLLNDIKALPLDNITSEERFYQIFDFVEHL